MEGAKERLTSQSDLDNREGEGRTVGGKHSLFIYVDTQYVVPKCSSVNIFKRNSFILLFFSVPLGIV